MSLDLQWDLLDSSLASSLVDMFNRQLENAPRPFFIGPIQVVSFDFGTVPPDLELVDMRDIYRDFMEDDEDEGIESDGAASEQPADDDSDAFEWVSRRSVPPSSVGDGPQYHHLPPHVRYGGGPVTDMFASLPALRSPREPWGAPLSASVLGAFPGYRSPFAAGAFASRSAFPSPRISPGSELPPSPPSQHTRSSSPPSLPSQDAPPPPPPPSHPNLQLHVRVHWSSNLRLTLTTSLLINYPSPGFLSLPIKLTVTGLVFSGELALAYEGARRRAHVCVLDELDPYGPIGDRAPVALRRTSTASSLNSSESPPDGASEDSLPPSDRPRAGEKPAPVGQRLLPAIYIESEIGQTDKHVLKNVTRIERFIQDVLRKTIEEELVFPNFHTIILGES